MRKTIAWTMLVGGIVTWPVAMLTFASDEQPVTLSLSFLALIYEGFNAVQVAGQQKEE
jgi:hypothetical protein